MSRTKSRRLDTAANAADRRATRSRPVAAPRNAAYRAVPDAGEAAGFWARRQYWVLAAVVLLSLVSRAVYFVQLNDGPCIWQHRWAGTDMDHFDTWGRQIAAGDWRSAAIGVPMSDWHVQLALRHLADHPQDVPGLQIQAASDPDTDRNRAVARALWTNWSGGKTFYQDPLYPYLVGLTYALAGPDPRWVFLWQMLVGVGTNVALFLIAKRCFGPTVGGVAGLLATLCSPLMYYELILLREPLIVFTGLMLVWLTLTMLDRRTWPLWLLTGVTLGLAVLLKSTLALLALGLLIGLATALRRQLKSLLPGLATAAAGLALTMSPLAVRNVAVGAPTFALASGGTITFISHNAEDYNAEVGGFWVSSHGARIMGDSGGKFFGAAVETLKTHTLGSYLRQLLNKFASIWRWYEGPNNSNFYVYRMYAWILYLPATFLVIGSLGAVGLVLGGWRWRKAWPLYVLIVASLAPLLAFMVMSRLRLPLVAGLIPFAALTIVEVVRWVRTRTFLPAALALGGVAAAALLIDRPLPAGTPLLRPIDCAVPYQIYYGPRIQAALQAGDGGRAADECIAALRYVPAFVRRIGPAQAPESTADAVSAMFYADRFHECSLLLQETARPEPSQRYLQRAEELKAAAQPFLPPGSP